MDGVDIGIAIAEMRAEISEIHEQLSGDRWAESAALTAVVEHVAAIEVIIESHHPAEDISEEVSEPEGEGEEIVIADGEIVAEGDPLDPEVEAAVAEILDDVGDAVDEVTPQRLHPLHRRFF